MYLPNIRTIGDVALAHWIHQQITDRVPESLICDYKEDLDISSESAKKELAKDVSGFANEIGGIILIGVKEERIGGKPTGIPASEYGIKKKEEAFELSLENVIRSGVAPKLPVLTIRKVATVSNPSRWVYAIYHPASWSRPHMVTLGRDKRYYRRTDNATVPMREHEVKALYEERLASRFSMDAALKSLDFGEKLITNNEGLLKIVVAPLPLLSEQIDFGDKDAREFLKMTENHLFDPRGASPWYPCRDGVITVRGIGDPSETRYVGKIHRNGAVTLLIAWPGILQEEVPVHFITERICDEGLIKFACRFFDYKKFCGDMLFRAEFGRGMRVLLTSGRRTHFSEPPRIFTEESIEIEGVFDIDQFLQEGRALVQKDIGKKVANHIGYWDLPT